MTSASLKSIMQSRIGIPSDANARTFEFTVQGNGNVIDVKDRKGELVMSTIPGSESIVLQKKIFNVRANSQLAMSNPRNVEYLRNGLKAEKANGKVAGTIGGVEGEYSAHEYFNAYLNAVQMSFGILLPNAKSDKLADGVRIAATIETITTELGSVMTLASNTISILAPDKGSKTTFNLEDFIAADAPATVVEGSEVKA